MLAWKSAEHFAPRLNAGAVAWFETNGGADLVGLRFGDLAEQFRYRPVLLRHGSGVTRRNLGLDPAFGLSLLTDVAQGTQLPDEDHLLLTGDLGLEI